MATHVESIAQGLTEANTSLANALATLESIAYFAEAVPGYDKKREELKELTGKARLLREEVLNAACTWHGYSRNL